MDTPKRRTSPRPADIEKVAVRPPERPAPGTNATETARADAVSIESDVEACEEIGPDGGYGGGGCADEDDYD
jgi:hypothetical protein